MIDALPRRSRLRIIALTVFALIASLLGVAAAPAMSANADAVYGSIRVVDSQGDAVANLEMLVMGSELMGDVYFYATGHDGTTKMQVDNTPRVAASLAVFHEPVGGGSTTYYWVGGSTLQSGGDQPTALAMFSPSSTNVLELVLPVDQPDGGISGTRSLNPAVPDAHSTVSLYTSSYSWVRSAQVGPDGKYAFTGLPAGSYKLLFHGDVTGGSFPYDYNSRWYLDSDDFDSAATVNITTTKFPGINQTLNAVASARGVVGPRAADLSWPVVAFFPSTWETVDWDSEDIRWGLVWDNEYSVELPPGSYRVAFGDRVTISGTEEWDAVHQFTPVEYWENSATRAGSKVLTLAPGDKKMVNGLDAPKFRDIASGSQFEWEIMWLASSGITTGYDDGTFKPLATVNRDAMAAFLYRYANKPAFTPPAVSPFVDVPTSNKFYKEITWLASTGITTGWDIGGGKKEFRPLQPVARDAMAAFLYRFAQSPTWTGPATSPFTDVPKTHQFYKEITWLADRGVSTGWDVGGGKKEFRPLGTVARDAMAAFLYRMPSWYRWYWLPE